MDDASDEPPAGPAAEEPMMDELLASHTATGADGSSADNKQTGQPPSAKPTGNSGTPMAEQIPAANALQKQQSTITIAESPAPAADVSAVGPPENVAGAAVASPRPVKKLVDKTVSKAASKNGNEATTAANEPILSALNAEPIAQIAAGLTAAVKPKQPAAKTAAKTAAAAALSSAEQKGGQTAAAASSGAEQKGGQTAAAGSIGSDAMRGSKNRSAVDGPAAGTATAQPAASASQAAKHTTAGAGTTDPLQHPAESAAKSGATKQPAAVSKKPAKVSVAGDASSVSANSPAAAPSTHSSNASKKGLHSLFGEASTVSVLSQEGSEMPGSRPPAQLHAALDGHDHGQAAGSQMDDDEQEEIQKIISEIHGTGDESSGEDEPEDQRLADIKHHLVQAAAVPGSQRSSGVGAVPSSLMTQQQQTVDDIVVCEEPAVNVGGVATEAASDANADMTFAAAEQHNNPHVGLQGERVSPWPSVAQIQQELLDADSSVEDSPAARTAAEPAVHPSQLADCSPQVCADADAGVDGVVPLGMGPEGLMLAGGYEDPEAGAAADEDQRSRAIAQQLAELHEESRRLQLQSQVLQHRAIEMSLQMAVGSSVTASDSHNSLTNPAHQSHHTSGNGALHQDGQAVAAGSSSMNSSQALGGFSQALTPDGLPLNPDALGLGDGVLPRHPPGDTTPSSVASSRAGLNWNIPSRGSIPSPGKRDSYSPAPGSPYLVSADAPRSGFNTIAQGFALHADPSLDYQMYSYHDSSQKPGSNKMDTEPLYGLQHQPAVQHYQPVQQHDMHHQPQQHQPQQQLQSQQPQQQQQQSQHPYTAAPPPVTKPGAEAAANDLPSPSAAMHRKRSFKSQTSMKSSAGQKGAAAPLVVRKPTLPVKQGPGASTRIAAAGATAGRRSSCDNVGSYYGLVEETPAVGTYSAAYAVAGAHGTVAKAKQQQAIARVSPRGSAAAAPAAVNRVSAAAVTNSSKLAGSTSRPQVPAKARSGSVSPSGGPTAAALAAAAAAATASGTNHHSHHMHSHPSAAAGPWGPMPANPYAAAAAAAAAMYGVGYAPMNPAMMPVMARNGQMQMQGPANLSSNRGISNKLNHGRAAGPAGLLGPESLAAMAAAVPPGAAWMPVGMPPGFMAVMPQGPVSAPGGQGGFGAQGYGPGGALSTRAGQNPNKAVPGVVEGLGKVRRGPGGAGSAPPGMQYGLPGVSPPAYMAMPGAPYPAVGFNPYTFNPQQAAMGASGRAGAAVRPVAGGGGGSVHRAGKGAVPTALTRAGPGFVPSAAGYAANAAAAAAWGQVMGPPGQFGMLPVYGAVPMAGLKQQVAKGGKGAAAVAGKGGWQS